MKSKIVPYDSLAALVLLEKELEPTPDVFRCQPNVTFIITFEEYINFCTYQLGRVDYLATPTKTLHSLIGKYRLGGDETARRELFSAFLKDVAYAVCKELYYAEAFGKGATNIVHHTEDGVRMGPKDIESYFANVAGKVAPELLSRLSCKDYAMPPSISPRNAYLWKYAVVAYFLSTVNSFYWSYNIK